MTRSSAGANLRAARATVRALRCDGRLGELDRAAVTAFLSLAEAVDESSGNANLWRQYRDAESALRSRRGDGGDNVVDLLGRLRAPVRDPSPPGAGDAGA